MKLPSEYETLIYLAYALIAIVFLRGLWELGSDVVGMFG
jgi:hypothetical protein